jgi:hypothetical protein
MNREILDHTLEELAQNGWSFENPFCYKGFYEFIAIKGDISIMSRAPNAKVNCVAAVLRYERGASVCD